MELQPQHGHPAGHAETSIVPAASKWTPSEPEDGGVADAGSGSAMECPASDLACPTLGMVCVREDRWARAAGGPPAPTQAYPPSGERRMVVQRWVLGGWRIDPVCDSCAES